MADLAFRVDKPDNVYRFIEEWEAIPATTGNDIHYLFLYGIFQWRGSPIRAFTMVMQYDSVVGQSVDLSNPAHIRADDAERVWDAFAAFRARCQPSAVRGPNQALHRTA